MRLSRSDVTISIIVAVAANNVIGREGGMPWHLPEDLKRFKAITMGKPIIMGRLTHESIGRPLPGRRNIVVSGQAGFAAEGVEVVACPADALRAVADADEVMVIGGGEIYRQFLRRTDRIYLTRIDAEIEGDVRFPELNLEEWEVTDVEDFPAAGDREYAFRFEVLERRPHGGPPTLDER